MDIEHLQWERWKEGRKGGWEEEEEEEPVWATSGFGQGHRCPDAEGTSWQNPRPCRGGQVSAHLPCQSVEGGRPWRGAALA